MKKLMLMNYKNDMVETKIDLEMLAPIAFITIKVVSGDEIVIIRWKDGASFTIDSDVENKRILQYYDGEYTLYDSNWDAGRINEMLKRFENRRDSYTLLYNEDLYEEK